jgi:hypothetical protein
MPVMDFDKLFGPLIDPMPNFRGITVYDFEKTFAPHSLTTLGRETARQLKSFMDEVLRGFEAGRLLSNDINVIWIATEDGEILFAVEEMFHQGEAVGRPKFREFLPTFGIQKLGHPSLINGDPGRIAGEIYFGINESTYWIINNRSGRYGLHKSRTYMHLKNVANKFRSYGIELKIQYEAR